MPIHSGARKDGSPRKSRDMMDEDWAREGSREDDEDGLQVSGQGAERPANPLSRSDPLAQQQDPFADLLQLSFPHLPTTTSRAASAQSRASASPSASGRAAPVTSKNMAPAGALGGGAAAHTLAGSGGSLAAKRRKSQESRQKRDQFLSQMSSFLEGIESSAGDTTVVPPDPPASFAVGSGPERVSSTSPVDDPFLAGSAMGGQSSRTDTLRPWQQPIPGDVLTRPGGSSVTLRRATAAAPAASSLMHEDASSDPFSTTKSSPKSPQRPHTRAPADLRGFMGSTGGSHPRGSLFEDDVEPEYIPLEQDDVVSKAHDKMATEPTTRRRGQAAALAPFQSQSTSTRSLSQPRSRSKQKSGRGLDLEEVRRRTSLLSGDGRASPSPSLPRAATTARSAAPRAPDASHFSDAGRWREGTRPLSSPDFGEPTAAAAAARSHLPHARPSDPLFAPSGGAAGTFDERGNYFNEDLLLARARGGSGFDTRTFEDAGAGGGSSRSGSMGQAGWRGDALRDSAGNLFNTARDGAKTLLRDAKAGVDAVGSSWQNSRQENGARFERSNYGNGDSRAWPSKTSEGLGSGSGGRAASSRRGEREFDGTFGEGRLGFTLFREETGPRKGQGVVCRVHPGSTAQQVGVQLGDTVVGVNRRRYGSYDEVMAVLPKLPRPVLITFMRGTSGQVREGDMMADARRASTPTPGGQQQGGGNPLEWLAKLNPFDRQRREGQQQLRGERRNSADALSEARASSANEYGLPGEVFAQGVRGGVFSWSYYGTSDGVEANTRDTYTEHVMRCQWGRTVDTMQSWMVARRYREFDAMDLDLRDAYPDRKDALPRLPPKEFFKMAPDVVERRTKGLDLYMTTIIRRFPDMLESSQLDRFLTISERIASMRHQPPAASAHQGVTYRNLGAHGTSSNLFPSAESSVGVAEGETNTSALVGTDYILNLMSSEEAYRLSQVRRCDPLDPEVAEDLIRELEEHLTNIPPTAHILSDASLYGLVERCQRCWPRIKASAAAAVSGEWGRSETLLPRIVACDESMERAFGHLRSMLASRGYL